MTVPGRDRDPLEVLADVAERLQRRLLPGPPPDLAGLDIAFTYRSASTGVLSGGDFVDYFTRPPSGSIAFAIGDVAGKGVDAMATTFVTKFMLRAAVHGAQLSWPTRPGEALQELRNGLLEQPDFAEDTERFVTVLFGQLTPRTGLLQLASAGHPTPFLVRATGVERPLLVTEAAIGVELDAALEAYPTEILSSRRETSSWRSPTASPSCATRTAGSSSRAWATCCTGATTARPPTSSASSWRPASGSRCAALGRPRRPLHPAQGPAGVNCSRAPADKGGIGKAYQGGPVSTSSRLRSQDGFIREVVWIVVILAIIAVVILDGMAVFNAHQSVSNTSSDAAQAALTEYAQSQNAPSAKLAAQEQLSKNGLTMVSFKITQNPEGNTKIVVSAKDHADTYALHFLGQIPPFKHWVERVTNPVRSGSAE